MSALTQSSQKWQTMRTLPESIETEGVLSGGYVRMGPDEAASFLRERYAIEGRAQRFDTEKDDTFRIDSRCGARFVMKISNPFEDLHEIQFQTALLNHVTSKDPDFPTFRLLKGIGDSDILKITDKAGQPRQIRLMTFVNGVPLDSTISSKSERIEVGKILARLRLATATFEHPHDRHTCAWDVQHLLSLQPLLNRVRDDKKRTLLAKGLERFAAIAPRIAKLRSQVLHNDFSKSNIIVDHAAKEFVTGIIDFGDSVRTAIAIDVSTALLNQLPFDADTRNIDDLFFDGRPLLYGYLSVADLTKEELMLIPHFVMGRIVARALLTLWRAELFPQNSHYILRNTEQGWGQLRWFLDRSPSEVSNLLI